MPLVEHREEFPSLPPIQEERVPRPASDELQNVQNHIYTTEGWIGIRVRSLLTYMMQKHEGRDLGAVLGRWLSPSDKSPKVAEKKGRTRIITCRRTKAVYCKAESGQSKQVILRRENCVV